MQHLELARDIAERMNTKYGGSKWKKLGGRGGRIFKVPDAFIAPVGARIMSLTVSPSLRCTLSLASHDDQCFAFATISFTLIKLLANLHASRTVKCSSCLHSQQCISYMN